MNRLITLICAVAACFPLAAEAEDKPVEKVRTAHFIVTTTWMPARLCGEYDLEVWTKVTQMPRKPNVRYSRTFKDPKVRAEALPKSGTVKTNENPGGLWVERTFFSIENSKLILILNGWNRWLYRADTKQIAEGITPGDTEEINPLSMVDVFKESGRLIGSATIGATPCDIYECTFVGSPATGWVSRKDGFLVKTVYLGSPSVSGSTVTRVYKNVELDIEIPDDLFRPPADAKFIVTREPVKK